MKLLSYFNSIFVFLFTVSAFAGGWSSGGGELLKDSRNPWFLNNTKDVRYCVQIDEQNLGVSKDVVERLIVQALQFWKSEFKQATPASNSRYGQTQIASQNFHQVDCANPVDITFQFGQLSEVQKKALKNPSEYAAISVRTSYSNVDMRGKGFIYISPSTGPLAYNPEGVVANAWSKNNRLLYLTLVHELGHVFGLPHMGSFGDLMSEGFVESILAYAKVSDSVQQAPNFFTLPKSSNLICTQDALLEEWMSFFGMDPTDKCLQFKFVHDDQGQTFGITKMILLASASKNAAQRKISEIDLVTKRFNPSYFNLIWLPVGQKVFSKEDLLMTGMQSVLGVSMISMSKNGTFFVNGGRDKHQVTVRFEQGKQSFSIDGVDEQGNIITIL